MGVIFFNSIEQIYSKGIIENDDTFECSVCGKTYKRESSAIKHFEAMNCHSYRNIFDGTEAENNMYNLFVSLLAIEGKRCISRAKFQKSKLYTPIAKFMLFCHKHKIQDQGDYLTYVLENTYWKTVGMGLSNAIKDSSLKEYRKHKVKFFNQHSEKFFNMNKERILTDTSFVLRSLERGDISHEYLFKQIDFDEFINMLSGVEIERLERYLIGVVGE